MNAPAIRILDVHKHYGSVHALRGIRFSIEPGEFFGLLGPNGAGKSTLINIMAGLVRAGEGTISILGHDVVTDFRNARRKLGVVPQELVYDPFFNVREVLRLQAGYFGLGRSRDDWIDELLSIFNLTHKADANLHDLSGGMKRRVLIAQAMVHKPRVLVLDEPTAGVDVELRKSLWKFARRLHQDGHTILLTTHYLEEAEALCDRIAILNHGSLIELGTRKKLLSRHPYRFLCLTLINGEATLPEGLGSKVVSREGRQVMLRLHQQDDPIGTVIGTLRDAGVDIIDLHTREPTLEDIFLDLISDPEQEVATE